MQKIAIVTGMTGQDGSYLIEHLLNDGYKVYAGIRKVSGSLLHNPNIQNILNHPNLSISSMDFLNSGSVKSFIKYVEKATVPYMSLIGNYVEVYNLAAQSHVGESFKIPEITHQINAIGVVVLLESLTQTFKNRFRFYQASTSELFGNSLTGELSLLSEVSDFSPTSPYAIAKHAAFQTVKHYRNIHHLHAVNGILFNHESPRRGLDFVTRKITRGVAEYATGKNKNSLGLGNIHAKRDWGDARDYILAMQMMLQTSGEDTHDYVVATGESHSVKDFCNLAFEKIGIKLEWKGEGINEKALGGNSEVLIHIDPKFYRPSDVHHLLGDSTCIRNKLGWKPTHSFKDLVFDMVENDIQILKGV